MPPNNADGRIGIAFLFFLLVNERQFRIVARYQLRRLHEYALNMFK
jgi:hypothetical protein